MSGSARVGAFGIKGEVGKCSIGGSCTVGSIKATGALGADAGASAASNGDVSVEAQLGVKVGVTIHAGEIVTGTVGALKYWAERARNAILDEAQQRLAKKP